MVENKRHLYQVLSSFGTLLLFDYLDPTDRQSFAFPYIVSFAFWNLNKYFESLDSINMPPKTSTVTILLDVENQIYTI